MRIILGEVFVAGFAGHKNLPFPLRKKQGSRSNRTPDQERDYLEREVYQNPY